MSKDDDRMKKLQENSSEMKKRAWQESRLKIHLKLFKSIKLSYSVDEADRRSCADFASVGPIGTDWADVFADKSFEIIRGRIAHKAQEMSANIKSHGEIDLIYVFKVGLRNNNVINDYFGEIVHDDSGEDFLSNAFPLFAVEAGKEYLYSLPRVLPPIVIRVEMTVSKGSLRVRVKSL